MAINPLQAPINYSAQMVDLGPAFAGAGQAFQSLGESYKAQAKETEAKAAKQQFAIDLQTATTDGSQKAWLGMIAKYPQFREAFGDVRKGVGEERLKNEFTQGFEISNAMEAKNFSAAIERTQNLIAAKKNSGEPTKIYEDVLSALEKGDFAAAQSGANLSLAVLDPDRYEKSVKARTTATKAPFELTEAEAKAGKAKSDAEIRAEEAKNIAQTVKADLEKKAADLGLTKAQTGSALAQTRKLGIESQRAALELEGLKATGGLDPAKTFDQEEKLRKEYQGRTKVYGELGSTYSNIKASAGAKTGPGDIALITGFMKMLDPGSVVRETEFATARDTAGLYTKLENSLKKAESGQFLQPKQREEFVALANEYYKSAQKKAGEDKKALSVVVKNYRLNPENVFGQESVVGGRGAVNPSRVVTVDY